jgi:hypothetical protein
MADGNYSGQQQQEVQLLQQEFGTDTILTFTASGSYTG